MYMHSFACILACVAALSPAFQRTADSGVLWNAGLRAPTHATMHVYHACTILHIISDVHAACHGACAHVERARGRDPSRARQRRSLAGGTGSVSVRILACSLFRISCHTISYMLAAWHAIWQSLRLAGPGDLHTFSMANATGERLAMSGVARGE